MEGNAFRDTYARVNDKEREGKNIYHVLIIYVYINMYIM